MQQSVVLLDGRSDPTQRVCWHFLPSRSSPAFLPHPGQIFSLVSVAVRVLLSKKQDRKSCALAGMIQAVTSLMIIPHSQPFFFVPSQILLLLFLHRPFLPFSPIFSSFLTPSFTTDVLESLHKLDPRFLSSLGFPDVLPIIRSTKQGHSTEMQSKYCVELGFEMVRLIAVKKYLKAKQRATNSRSFEGTRISAGIPSHDSG